MGLIYRTTNMVNGMMYIGKQLDEKKKNYLGSGTYIKRAIKKYGKENFKKEILIRGIEDHKDLCDIEVYFIAYYGAQADDRYYNITEGGDRTTIGIKSSTETRLKQSIASKGRRHHTLMKPLLQYDLQGNLIAEYIGVWPACIELGWPFSRTTDICRVCNNTKGRKSAYGYKWQYKIPTSK